MGRDQHRFAQRLPRPAFRASLNLVLAKHRGVRKIVYLPPMTIQQILAWADEHYRHTGKWPQVSTPMIQLPGAVWNRIDSALRRGSRGLPGGSSLYRLSIKHRRIKPGRRADARQS